ERQQQLGQGRLARTVWSEQAENLARLDSQVDAPNGPHRAARGSILLACAPEFGDGSSRRQHANLAPFPGGPTLAASLCLPAPDQEKRVMLTGSATPGSRPA